MKTTRSGIGTMIMTGLAMISATATGCAGDPSAPTERNFQSGIEAYYERVRPCFDVAGVYPNTVRLPRQQGQFLTDMGFATEGETVENAYGRPIQQWDLIAAGRAAVDSIIEPKPYEPGDRVGEDWGRTTFCYSSEYVVRGIVDSSQPVPDLFGLIAWVTYEYEVTGAADWAETARTTVERYIEDGRNYSIRSHPFIGIGREDVLRDLRALNEPQTHRVNMGQSEYGWFDPRSHGLD